MNEVEQATDRNLRAARIHLLSKHPFFGDLAFGMPFIYAEQVGNTPIKTAATDGESIYWNPKFVNECSPQERVFVLAHEVMHPALMHCVRRGNRDPKGWNIAADVVINYMLIQSGCGTMPKIGINRPDLYAEGGGKVEKIYDLLMQEKEDSGKNFGEPGDGKGGEDGDGSLDICLDADPSKKETVAAKWRTKMTQAIQVAKMAGNCPGVFEEVVSNIVEPRMPWQQVLRRFLITTKGDDRTWAKPNRRYQSSGIYLPGAIGVKCGAIGIGSDNSGSINKLMVSQMEAEIKSICEEIMPEKIHVFFFDTRVAKHIEFDHDEDFDFKAYGRGGTAFSPVFRFIEEEGIEPMAIVMLTDLDCNDFGPQPDYPVLWVTCGRTYAPWGEVLEWKE